MPDIYRNAEGFFRSFERFANGVVEALQRQADAIEAIRDDVHQINLTNQEQIRSDPMRSMLSDLIRENAAEIDDVVRNDVATGIPSIDEVEALTGQPGALQGTEKDKNDNNTNGDPDPCELPVEERWRLGGNQ